VGRQRDLFREFGRHGRAMGEHMADWREASQKRTPRLMARNTTNKIENESEYILCL
jgi:hypothetical protein